MRNVISTALIEALKSYYANVHACVDVLSVSRPAPFDSTMGVKQGCPMSPTLLGLYVNQLETYLQHHVQDAPELQGHKVSMLLYADDNVRMSRSTGWFAALVTCTSALCVEKPLSVEIC